MLAVTTVAPSRRLLGTLNGAPSQGKANPADYDHTRQTGVAQMCSSLMRSIGPLGASSLFVSLTPSFGRASSSPSRLQAFSITTHAAGGLLIYFVMITVAVVGAAAAMLLRDEVMGWRQVHGQGVVVQESEDLDASS